MIPRLVTVQLGELAQERQISYLQMSVWCGAAVGDIRAPRNVNHTRYVARVLRAIRVVRIAL